MIKFPRKRTSVIAYIDVLKTEATRFEREADMQLDRAEIYKRLFNETHKEKEKLTKENKEYEARIAELKSNADELQGLLDRADVQVSDALKKEDLLPEKPAGFPDRIDAICKGIYMWHELIDELAEDKENLTAYLAEGDRVVAGLVAVIKANPSSRMNEQQENLFGIAKQIIEDAKIDRANRRRDKAEQTSKKKDAKKVVKQK